MKHWIAALVLVAGAGSVCADELSDAASALDKKNYAVAVASYTKLANAGNPEAMLRLGEMYWYGEGVPLDRAKGDALFAKAAAAGNQGAAASLKLSAQRQARMADIAYWTSGYDGADLTAGKYACVAPVFPPYSETKRAVAAVSDSYAAYIACYNAFIDNIGAAMPAGKRIPEEVALLMSEDELAQARAHLDKVYTAAAARGRAAADQTLAQNAAWAKGTEEYLKTQQLRRDQLQAEMDRQRASNANTSVGGRVQGGSR
ncbi:MAG: hypothetical protein JWP59_2352 [Massilia sp.]|nr:hypothetical protein [Massilia sp.]